MYILLYQKFKHESSQRLVIISILMDFMVNCFLFKIHNIKVLFKNCFAKFIKGLTYFSHYFIGTSLTASTFLLEPRQTRHKALSCQNWTGNYGVCLQGRLLSINKHFQCLQPDFIKKSYEYVYEISCIQKQYAKIYVIDKFCYLK